MMQSDDKVWSILQIDLFELKIFNRHHSHIYVQWTVKFTASLNGNSINQDDKILEGANNIGKVKRI